jgi:DNA-binding transcriptional MerR regulator
VTHSEVVTAGVAQGVGVTEYRIDDLARAADTSVRNVRYYQDSGMLPAPRRQGRVALYSDAHLARLRLITRLLERGYTAANITELAGAWEQGRDLSDVLGLERVVSGLFSAEIPGFLTAAQIHELFATPEVESGLIDKMVHAGLAAPEGDRYRIPSPCGVPERGTQVLTSGDQGPLVVRHDRRCDAAAAVSDLSTDGRCGLAAGAHDVFQGRRTARITS